MVVLYNISLSVYLSFFCRNFLTMGDKKLLLKLGERIKTIRTGKNMTQNELAMDCGFDKASISRIESGQTNITMHSLYKISKALEVEIIELLKD